MSFQKTQVIGNVGRVGEMRETAKGNQVINFSIAVNEKKFGETERVTWFDVTAWNVLAGIVAEFVEKGKLVMVEGSISAEAWTDNEGQARATLKLTANNIRFLG